MEVCEIHRVKFRVKVTEWLCESHMESAWGHTASQSCSPGSHPWGLSNLLDVPHTAFQVHLLSHEISCSVGFTCPSPSLNHLQERHTIWFIAVPPGPKHDIWEAASKSFWVDPCCHKPTGKPPLAQMGSGMSLRLLWAAGLDFITRQEGPSGWRWSFLFPLLPPSWCLVHTPNQNVSTSKRHLRTSCIR